MCHELVLRRSNDNLRKSNTRTLAPSWRTSAPMPAYTSKPRTHYFTHPPNHPPPFDTSRMRQIGVTLDNAQVVLEVNDSSTEGVGIRDPRRPRPDTPCLPFVLMTEKPVLAEPGDQGSEPEEQEPKQRSEDIQMQEEITGRKSVEPLDPRTEDQSSPTMQLGTLPNSSRPSLVHSSSSGSTSNEETSLEESINDSLKDLLASERLIDMKNYVPAPEIHSSDTDLFESAYASIHNSPNACDNKHNELFSMDITPARSPVRSPAPKEKPSDILDAALLRLTGKNTIPRSLSIHSLDDDLDDIPELQTPSSSGESSRAPSPAYATCGSNSLLLQEGYVLIPTVDIVHEAGELRRYAPTPDWKGHYVEIENYVDMKRDGARRKEVWEDDMTARLGDQVITALRDRLSIMLDHRAMEKGEEFDIEDLRREAEEAHDTRDVAATEKMASIFLDNQLMFVPQREQFYVTEDELNLASSYAGVGMRQMPADPAVPALPHDSYPRVYSRRVQARGPARLAATTIEFLLRGNQCTELTRIRIVLLEFIEQAFTLMCRRHLHIDTTEVHTKSPPPFPSWMVKRTPSYAWFDTLLRITGTDASLGSPRKSWSSSLRNHRIA
ncbi:hypothetical protein K438DRAFT_858785 [Mycena galopus ATCC 62051]|nr:hypothetical protein K438DRAFT_858785 [Mycena galopus ATCC 62051]